MLEDKGYAFTLLVSSMYILMPITMLLAVLLYVFSLNGTSDVRF